MRRSTTCWLSLVLMLAALVWGGGHLAAAQDSTPTAPDSFELAPGVVADSFVFVEGREDPLLYTLHFDPGVVYAVEPGINLELGYLEAGTLTMTLEVPVTIAQVGDTASAGEVVEANTEITLSVAGVLLDDMATPAG